MAQKILIHKHFQRAKLFSMGLKCIMYKNCVCEKIILDQTMIFPNPQKKKPRHRVCVCEPYHISPFLYGTHTHTPIVCTCLDDFQTVVDSLTSPRGLCFLPMNPPPHLLHFFLTLPPSFYDFSSSFCAPLPSPRRASKMADFF